MPLDATTTGSASPAKPKTMWEKVIASTPVIMTVIATVLAGLSSGEMSRAQYFRALAAQAQSKAGDQWNFYQAKRNRGASAEHVLDGQALTGAPVTLFDPAELKRVAEGAGVAGVAEEARAFLADPQAAGVLGAMARREFPRAPQTPIADAKVKALVDALAAGRTDEQTVDLVRQVDESSILAAVRGVEADGAAFDTAVGPFSQLVGKVEQLVGRLADATAGGDAAAQSAVTHLRAGFTNARLRFEAARYREEAVNNLPLGRLYEASVRYDAFLSDRHRVRSNRFFYGMLAAQGAVTLATLALAARERNFFWGLATAAGLAAITFGAYVFLFV